MEVTLSVRQNGGETLEIKHQKPCELQKEESMQKARQMLKYLKE